IVAIECIERFPAHAAADHLGQLLFHALANLGAHLGETTLFDTVAAEEFLVDFRKRLFLDRLYGEVQLGRLAGELTVAVSCRKHHVQRALLARPGLLETLLELGHRLTAAEHHMHVGEITALERLAADASLVIDPYPVCLVRSAIDRRE